MAKLSTAYKIAELFDFYGRNNDLSLWNLSWKDDSHCAWGKAKSIRNGEASLYSFRILECRVEFFSRCPYTLSRVSSRLASPIIFLASSSIRFSYWYDKTQLVFRSRMCGVDIPKIQCFKLSSHGRCLVYRLYVLRRALFARPRCYQSYYVYRETRSLLDGGEGTMARR